MLGQAFGQDEAIQLVENALLVLLIEVDDAFNIFLQVDGEYVFNLCHDDISVR